MTVALALAVLVALVSVAALVAQQRALSQARVEAAAAGVRAEAAEAQRRGADLAAATAAARTRSLETAQEELARQAGDRARALAASEQRVAQAEAAREECEAAHRAAEQALADATRSLEEADEGSRLAAARVADLEGLLGEVAQRAGDRAEARQTAQGRASGLQAVERQPGAGGPDAARVVEACWHLLLARVERQWAHAVGAGPEERGLAQGDHQVQLAEALRRELERLREEVGLHTELVLTGAAPDVHPLLVLLSAGEVVALAAPHSERVVVELDDRLSVAGDGWSGDEALADQLRAVVAGLDGTVTADDDELHVAIGKHHPTTA